MSSVMDISGADNVSPMAARHTCNHTANPNTSLLVTDPGQPSRDQNLRERMLPLENLGGPT